jgi:eukaryotic-like serine/threonine-protein kinase
MRRTSRGARASKRADELVAGRFHVERVVLAESSRTVCRAYDHVARSTVTLETVQATGMRAIHAFRRDATEVGSIHDGGIARVLAHGVTDDDLAWTACEWVEGETLERRLERGPLAISEAFALARRLGSAIAAAHARGVVHGALHPACVVVPAGQGADGAKILGFGRAELDASLAGSGEQAALGLSLGPSCYVAPEQARGSPDVDARVDVFALGCILYHAITGAPPFGGADAGVARLARVLFEDAPRVRSSRPEVPAALDGAIARLLSRDRSERPCDGAAALALIETARSGADDSSASTFEPVRSSGVALQEVRLTSVVVVLGVCCGGAAEAALERARPVATRFSARIDRLADGSLVVAIPSKGSARDQATQAARCALALRDLAGDAPIGVATGRGGVSAWRGDAGVVGEATERAAALARRAAGRAPTIAIDEASAGLLGPEFDVSGAPDARLLLARRAAAAGETTRTLLGRPTPFVGRDPEMAALRTMMDDCLGERHPQVVLVTGPSGVGKSRLRDEFVREVHERRRDVQVWTARGDPMTAGAPFGMLSQVVRELAGVGEDDGTRTRQAKLLARLSRTLKGADLQRVAEFLGEVAGVRFSEAKSVQLRAARRSAVLMGDQMRRAWDDFLAAECSAAPVLVVLDDLHWGDLPTVGFLHASLRRISDLPLMVIALARPDVHELFPRIWSGCGVTEIGLGELPRRAAERIVRTALGEGISEEAVARVVTRAAGNALYLEELVRSVAEGRDDASPPTVLAMVQARLERLAPMSRRVLRAASVFGTTWWRAGVAALLDEPEGSPAMSEALADLTQRELVSPRGRGRFRDETVFRHPIVREAAYEMLSDPDRRLGHRLAGEWLQRAGETDAMTLAEQFERGGDGARAGACYVLGARQALEGNDLAAVVARAERGMVCGARREDIGALRGLQAEAHRWRGELAAAERCAIEALESVPRESALWYDVAGELAVIAVRVGAAGHVERFVEPLCGEPEAAVAASQIAACASAFFPLRSMGKADLAARVLARLDRADVVAHATDPNVLARIQSARATAALFEGDQGTCLDLTEASVRAFEAAGDLRRACNQRMNAAYLKMTLGAFEAAEAELRSAVAAAERMGFAAVANSSRTSLGMTLALRGALHEARAIETLAVDAALEQGDMFLGVRARIYLAEILRMGRNLDGAEREALAALAALEPEEPARAGALATLALVRLAAGHASAALAAAREAMELLERKGGEYEARVRLAFAEVLWACGEHEEARAVVALARDRLHTHAARIHDEAYRRSFLASVPAHARTLDLARLWRA